MFMTLSSYAECERTLQFLEEASKEVYYRRRELEQEQSWEGDKTSRTWGVVICFCKLHKLPLSTWHLQQLAKENDWVGFLYQAQTHRYPEDQLLQIVKNNFSDRRLQGHLALVIANTTPKDWENAPGQILDSMDTEDEDEIHQRENKVWDIILSAVRRPSKAARKLLACAIEMGKPLFAVLAGCYEVRVYLCMQPLCIKNRTFTFISCTCIEY